MNQGHTAEFLARLYLRLKGYQILEADYITGRGTHAGEIDIIARRGHTLIFAEVKKRATIDQAAYAISETQRQRIRRGAEAFLQRHPQYAKHNLRFDALLVQFPLKIKHIENAF